MTASNSQGFKFDYDSQSGKYGYVVSEGGADTFVPFSSTVPLKMRVGTGAAGTRGFITFPYLLEQYSKVTVVGRRFGNETVDFYYNGTSHYLTPGVTYDLEQYSDMEFDVTCHNNWGYAEFLFE